MTSVHRGDTEADEMLLPSAAIRLLGVSRATYIRYLDKGDLVPDVVLPSGHRRFKRSTIEAFAHSREERRRTA